MYCYLVYLKCTHTEADSHTELQADLRAAETTATQKTVSNEQHCNHLCSYTPQKTPLPFKNQRDVCLKNTLVKLNKKELFGNNSAHHIWRKKGHVYDPKNTIPTVKYRGKRLLRS